MESSAILLEKTGADMYSKRTSQNRLYRIWTEARRRCNNPRQQSYMDRKISFSTEWDDYDRFRLWSLENGYKDNLSIDRKDNRLGYSPGNCVWSTRTEQQLNMSKKRGSKSKYIGVSQYTGSSKRSKPFRARVYIKGREIRLGDFSTEILAAEARDIYLVSNGINAVLNFPQNKYLQVTRDKTLEESRLKQKDIS